LSTFLSALRQSITSHRDRNWFEALTAVKVWHNESPYHRIKFSNKPLDPILLPVSPATRVADHHLSSTDLDFSLIGSSELMRQLKDLIRVVAPSQETVLITGESGTGKELIARAIHDLSPRRNKPFLAVNCGAFAESLLESELFGHVKGSFTGATTNKKGFFEAASGGTIFLDEFAEMSLTTQQRLLRVLQEGTVRPVGSTDAKEIQIDTRIVVATNHDLKRDIAEGKFRQDLFYRINVLQIISPALRDRREDILALAKHFIKKVQRQGQQSLRTYIVRGARCLKGLLVAG
jgi:transcriptional regulator with PAS, ATPase and Fis domain